MIWKPSRTPLLSLILTFVIWKAIIFLVVFASPGNGYDTSTTLLFDSHAPQVLSTQPEHRSRPFEEWFATKLVRWDAFYFVSIAKRGHLYEQEWAFGWGFTELISSTAILFTSSEPSIMNQAWAAVALANLCHLLSVLVLYYLAMNLLSGYVDSEQKRVSFAATCFHIFSPAGIFLSAPYSESLFSLLSISGMLCYYKSSQAGSGIDTRNVRHDLYLLAAGSLFGLATVVRSTGLFSGSIFFYDLVWLLHNGLLDHRLYRSIQGVRYSGALVLAGSQIAVGFIIPQYFAYAEYCDDRVIGSVSRPWCDAILPSIYSFVQEHYWNVGFFRYWTVSNLPLFALALPMLTLMGASAVYILSHAWNFSYGKSEGLELTHNPIAQYCLTRFALSQLLVAVLTFTNFHVQIITRISSGYPVFYLCAGAMLVRGHRFRILGRTFQTSRWIIRWSIIYAIVQAGLFASFLPPA